MSTCRICACTDTDCSWCIALYGEPCYWSEPNLCSACFIDGELLDYLRAGIRGEHAIRKARSRNAPGARELMRHGLTCRSLGLPLKVVADKE
jgi:hypothetical protein